MLEIVTKRYEPPKFIGDYRTNADYWNNVIKIKSFVNGCTIFEYKKKYYGIFPKFDRFVLCVMLLDKQDYPHELKIDYEMGEFPSIEDTLGFIDDEVRELGFRRITKFFESLQNKKSVKVRITNPYYNSNWKVSTNLEYVEMNSLKLLECVLNVKITSIVNSAEGFSCFVETEGFYDEVQKTYEYPRRCKRYTGFSECDVALCREKSVRGFELCKKHLQDWYDGFVIPTLVRGEEGFDVSAYILNEHAPRFFFEYIDTGKYSNPFGEYTLDDE